MDGSPLAGVTVTVAGIGLCGHTIPGLVTTATVTDAQGRYSIVVQDNPQLFHVAGGGAEGEARFVRAGFDDLCGVLRLLRAGRNVDVTLPRAGCHTFPDVPVPMVTRGADFIEFSWRRLEDVRDYRSRSRRRIRSNGHRFPGPHRTADPDWRSDPISMEHTQSRTRRLLGWRRRKKRLRHGRIHQYSATFQLSLISAPPSSLEIVC
jgi:hypothetical protein